MRNFDDDVILIFEMQNTQSINKYLNDCQSWDSHNDSEKQKQKQKNNKQ